MFDRVLNTLLVRSKPNQIIRTGFQNIFAVVFRDIENDLYNMRRQPPGEDRDLLHSWRGHGTYTSFEKEFQRMFHELENIFRGTFSERPIIEYKFHDFSRTPEEESKIFNVQFLF